MTGAEGENKETRVPPRSPSSRPQILIPVLLAVLCLAIHRLGFLSWFRADDFAWLGLAPNVHSFQDLLSALFKPYAQGTIRPWSERVFFMAGYTLFGLNALPYRIVIFATQFADLALVAWIGRRLTGSAAAGFLAGVLWMVNGSVMEPLGWACVYNEVMCAFFLLLAFYFLLRFIDTGARRFEVFQWITFVAGFGALELNVVYPALAAGYTLLCARRHFRRTLPMFAVSAAYTLVHNWAAPITKTGEYGMHFGPSMLRTLYTLWTWSVGPSYLSMPLEIPHWIVPAGIALVSAALLAFAAWRWRTGVAPFFLLWYLVTISPMLPLRDHATEYYVYLPVIGLSWLGGWALVQAWRSGIAPGVAAVAIALVYGFLQIPHLRAATYWNYSLTQRTRNLVEGVAGARELHPTDAILLYGVDSDLFWNALRDHPFRLLGIDHVYLAPGTEKRIPDNPEWGSVASFVLPSFVVTHELAHHDLVVYDVRGPQLRNMTSLYAALPRDNQLPRQIDVGDPLIADLLGPEWYKPDENHRWMPQRATLKLGGPTAPGQKLYLRGNCTAEQLHAGLVIVTVSVEMSALPAIQIHDTSFELELPLPAQLAGRHEIQIALEVNRTFRPATDARDLGLAFGLIEIR